MHSPRLLALAVAVAFLGVVVSEVRAQQQNAQPNGQQRSEEEQRDIETLVLLVDAVDAGTKPAPADIAVEWGSHHFVKSGDGSTYVPFTLAIDASQFAGPAVALYVRVVETQAAPAPEPDAPQEDQQARVTYPWDSVYFLDMPASGLLSRAMALQPGEYEAFIAVKEQSVGAPVRNAPPANMGLLRRGLMVPDFNGAELSTSSIIIANAIEPLAAPLSREEQQENPYTFGTMRVVPSPDLRLSKAGELQVLFWVYGTQHTEGKPDVVIEYNFHQKTADGELYFNRTAPQPLNAETLPEQFDVNAGHQLPGSLLVPLASFPEGEYRLEVTITDKLSGQTLTQNATFTVEA